VQPTPPPEPKINIEGVVCLPVTKGVKCLRGVCSERLKYEVEYSLKKGTSENSYLLSVSRQCLFWAKHSSSRVH
jgi:flavorubredoxin